MAKHQVYRFEGKEVILEEVTRDGTWRVREVSPQAGGVVLGAQHEAAASEVQWIGRAIAISDRSEKR